MPRAFSEETEKEGLAGEADPLPAPGRARSGVCALLRPAKRAQRIEAGFAFVERTRRQRDGSLGSGPYGNGGTPG
jgi:hypothetical protein